MRGQTVVEPGVHAHAVHGSCEVACWRFPASKKDGKTITITKFGKNLIWSGNWIYIENITRFRSDHKWPKIIILLHLPFSCLIHTQELKKCFKRVIFFSSKTLINQIATEREKKNTLVFCTWFQMFFQGHSNPIKASLKFKT